MLFRLITLTLTILCCFLPIPNYLQLIRAKGMEVKGGLLWVVKNENGWKIPGLEVCVADSQTRVVVIPNTPSIQLSILTLVPSRPSLPTYLFTYHYLSEDGKTLTVKQATLAIQAIHQYSINGKKFCFGVQVQDPQQKDPEDDMAGFYYYDNDGDGKFETLCHEGPPQRNRIPAWVIK